MLNLFRKSQQHVILFFYNIENKSNIRKPVKKINLEIGVCIKSEGFE